MHTDIFDLPTPALLLDLSRLERNAARMKEKVHRSASRFVPRQDLQIDRRATRARRRRGRADHRLDAGRGALLFRARGHRHPLRSRHRAGEAARSRRPDPRRLQATDHPRHRRSRRLRCERSWKPRTSRIEALIEIDSDGHRAGVAPDDPLLIDIGRDFRRPSRGRDDPCGRFLRLPHARRIRSDGGAGTLTYSRKRPSACASPGFGCPIVSVGSTPTLHYARGLEGVTEVRAGVYAFGDLVQAELGTCAMDDIAIGVLASVIGHNRHRARTDRRRLPGAEPRSGHGRPAARLGLWRGLRPGRKSHRGRYRLLDQPGARHHHQPLRARSISSDSRSAGG